MVNIKKGYACGGHGTCYFANDAATSTGLSLPAGCTCNSQWQGFFEFDWQYTTDCTTLDGTSLGTAATSLRSTSGCQVKGTSDYNLASYQTRCEDACPCSTAGTELCVNEPYRPTEQGKKTSVLKNVLKRTEIDRFSFKDFAQIPYLCSRRSQV